MTRIGLLGGLVLLLVAGVGGAQPAAAPAPVYDLVYDVMVLPSEKAAQVKMRVSGKGAWALKRVTLAIDPDRHRDFEGDGQIDVTAKQAIWRPPAKGGELRWTFQIDHLRDERQYDARITSTWAMFRGDDMMPPARVRTDLAAEARARLRLRLPDKWKAALTFEKGDDGLYVVENRQRRFDRPTGWFLLGKIKEAKTTVGGVKVTVVSPAKHRARAQDILAFLRWTMPDLRDAMGSAPERLLIVSAGDPMWRGGLSGPDSVYLHAERPLIDDDFSSPVLHEVMHAAMRARAGDDGDWIVEGLAELYSIEALRRAKGISKKRYERALNHMRDKGAAVKTLRVPHADSKVTGRAVWVLHQLDLEMQSRCQTGLDAVLKRLVAQPTAISTGQFIAVAEETGGCELDEFFDRWAPAVEVAAESHAVRQGGPGTSVPVP